MDLANPQTLKHLCRQYNLRPSRQNGQNFLIDKTVLDQLIKAAALKPTDTVLEVGAGFGVVTKELAKLVSRVIAVELDSQIIPALRENTRGAKNLTLVTADILKLNFSDYGLEDKKFKILASLPYNITSRFLRHILSNSLKPVDLTLIVQREVAERLCAKPGAMSLLSISIQFYSTPEIIALVPSSSFWPEPEVASAIIKISNIAPRPDVNEKDFFRLAKIGFSARRKMLKNNLSAGLKIKENIVRKVLESFGLNPSIRPQELAVEDWVELVNELNKFKIVI